MASLVNNQDGDEDSTPVSCSYQRNQEDWPWVWALREGLDWREHCLDHGASKTTVEQAQQEWQRKNPPVPFLHHLWIGSQSSCMNVDKLKQLGITHLLNMAAGIHCPVDEYQQVGIQYLALEAQDADGYPLLQKHLAPARAFFNLAKHEDNGICLVFCKAGLNRSGLIVAALAMLETRWDVCKTVAQLRRQRGDYALDNESFQEQLVALARREHLLGPCPGTPGSIVSKRPPPPPPGEEQPASRLYNMSAEQKALAAANRWAP